MPISGFGGCLLVLAGSLVAQTDWPIYGHDPGAMRYSLLKQINTKNVARIQLAWAFDTEAPITQAPGTQASRSRAGWRFRGPRPTGCRGRASCSSPLGSKA